MVSVYSRRIRVLGIAVLLSVLFLVAVLPAHAEEYIFILKWGSEGSGDGQFGNPMAVAVDGAGNVYVTEQWNDRVQKFTGSGTFITKWGSYGSGNGQFYNPRHVAVDGAGNVYVADQYNHRVQKFTGNGGFITNWTITYPCGVAVDGAGNVYVTDGNHRIQKFTSGGVFITKWGSYGSGDGEFYIPDGVAVDGAGNVYVADVGNHRIQKFGQRCSLAVTATAGGTTNPSPGSHTYDGGTVVDVLATPNAGYFFGHWELDGNNVGATNPYSVTMGEDHSLHAVFGSSPGVPEFSGADISILAATLAFLAALYFSLKRGKQLHPTRSVALPSKT